jgi:quercetin dioxygenase-like cupin family protein
MDRRLENKRVLVTGGGRGTAAAIGENRMNRNRLSICRAVWLLAAGLLSLTAVVWAQAGEKPRGVSHTPVTVQAIPNEPGRSLTAVVVELPPGASSPSHHHAGIVFAYVLKGTVRSQLDDGPVVEYRAGQYWVEPPGARHTLTQNPSSTEPARLLAVFVTPTEVQLTTYDR